MAYFIFSKNSDGLEGTVYRIAENQTDLDLLNISKSDYKIIEDSSVNFLDVKLNKKIAISYNDNTINYANLNIIFNDYVEMNAAVDNQVKNIDQFLKNNPNHTKYSTWNNYKNQLKSLDTKSIQYPLNKSLEQYINDLGQTFFNTLQLP
jgi:hypothetical protein